MAETTSFRPFDTLIDETRALGLLREAVAGADDGELFLERRRSEVLSYDDGRVRTASYNAAEGFGLRAVVGETAGYAHSTEISESALKRAVETARLAVGDGGGTLAEAPRATNVRLYGDADPMADAEFPVKIDTLREIDAFARALDSRVVQVSATLAASLQEVVILRPEGHAVTDTRPMTRLNISVIVEENGRRESGTAGGGGRTRLTGLIDPDHWQGLAREALRIALVNLEAVPAPAGVMDVALGPGWPGILLHEAIGHGLEGDFNRKKSSAFAGLMGQRIASKGVTVLDDGTLPDRRGSVTVDDEGTPGGKNTLIEDGVLVGYMQDRQNARLMGVAPTGNGRRESYAHAPMPRMTNTYMLSGDANPEDIVADVKDGIYAVGFGGGQVDITNGKFVFSCTEAYRVQDGKVGAPVKGATLIGDGATALKQIRAVGNDLALDPGHERAVGDAGRGKDHMFGDQIVAGIDAVEIGDPGLGGAAFLVIVAEQQAAEHLPAHAFQRGCCQHAFGRPARAHIHVDPGQVRFGAMHHAGHVPIGDQADGGAGLAHFGDHLFVARAFQNAHGDIVGRTALGGRQRIHAVHRRHIQRHNARLVARPDRQLVHVDVRRVQHRSARTHGNDGQRVGHVLGGQRGAFQRVKRDVHLRPFAIADFFADIQHRGLVALALADDHGALNVQFVQLVAHGVDGGLVGGFLVAAADPVGAGDGGLFGHARQSKRKHTVIEINLGGHSGIPSGNISP